MREITRPEKITLAEMRASGVRGLLVYCSDYHCSLFQFPFVQKKAPDDAGAQCSEISAISTARHSRRNGS
jgi:hypothetical protein